jgi:pseudouridylate synthase
MNVAARLLIADEVAEALSGRRPVVAHESTLISHGLPHPRNLEVARAAEAAVRANGAVPATVALRDGHIRVGLADDELEALANAPDVRKAARPNFGHALTAGGWAATTVSATMIAAHAAGIRVFATGGIGGVHRGAINGEEPSLDISSDLEELARTPVAVVCAGPKAILDVPATLEYLETRGVPVVVLGAGDVPGFFARSSGVPAPISAPDVDSAAALVRAQFELALGGGILVCVPVPEADAVPQELAEDAIERAVGDAQAAGIRGPATTPWLLARVAEITLGASIRANVSLIVNSAGTAARLAVRLGSAT